VQVRNDTVNDVFPEGHYCPEGSSSPVPCPQGTNSTSRGLSSASQPVSAVRGGLLLPALLATRQFREGYFCERPARQRRVCVPRELCGRGGGLICEARYWRRASAARATSVSDPHDSTTAARLRSARAMRARRRARTRTTSARRRARRAGSQRHGERRVSRGPLLPRGQLVAGAVSTGYELDVARREPVSAVRGGLLLPAYGHAAGDAPVPTTSARRRARRARAALRASATRRGLRRARWAATASRGRATAPSGCVQTARTARR
jgi:hypothetical protein